MSKHTYTLEPSGIVLFEEPITIAISKSEVNKLYKAWIFATACKSFAYALIKNSRIPYLLGQEISIPPVLPFLKDNLYEDLEKAFIVGASSRAKAVLKFPPYAEVAFHEHALPHLLGYSAVMVAKEAIEVERTDSKIVDIIANILAGKMKFLIKEDIMKGNIGGVATQIMEGMKKLSVSSVPVEGVREQLTSLSISSLLKGYTLSLVTDIPTDILQIVASDTSRLGKDSIVWDISVHVDLKEGTVRIVGLEPYDRNLENLLEKVKEPKIQVDLEVLSRYVWSIVEDKLDAIVKYLYAETERAMNYFT